MATIERASTHHFEEHEELFIDTNVWIFDSDASGNPRQKKLYSQVLNNIRNSNCRVCVDNLVISEFVNQYSRLRARKLGVSRNDFKVFRDSKDFLPIAEDVAKRAKEILEMAELIESGLATQDVVSILDDYAKGGADFNDQSFVETCKREGFKFLTDDGDFANAGIPILTENPRLLGSG